MLYLDNSATTSILPEVREAMLPFLSIEFGNPSSKYYQLALNAKSAVTEARENLASLLGCTKDEIYFTSGSTESNNMVIKGVYEEYIHRGNHIITSKVEHPSVLEVCKYLESKGAEITYLDVDKYGRVSLKELKKAITNKTILVSIMLANNELGSLNNICEISKVCHSTGVMFHTDATQAVGKIEININNWPGVTFLSCSAHKFHGPKGIGAVYIKNDQYNVPTRITPLLHGGGQENGIRNGTLAVHNIVGLGKAAELANKNLIRNITQLEKLEFVLIKLLKEKFSSKVIFNNDNQNKVPGIISVQFVGLNNEVLVKKLSPIIAVSTGSACSSSEPSHVLKATGLSIDEIRSTIRISLSPYTNEEELMIFNNL